MAAASDNLTLEEMQNPHNQSPLNLEIKEGPEDVLFSQRQPVLNASVSSKNRVLEQSATDSKGQQSKVPQLDDATDMRRISHVLSPQKHKEPQNNEDMQPCKDPPAQCEPTPPTPEAVSKVSQFGLLEARVAAGSDNVRRNHQQFSNCARFPLLDEQFLNQRTLRPQSAEDSGGGGRIWKSTEPNYAEGYTGRFRKARRKELCAERQKKTLSNCARFPLLDEQFLNQRTLRQQFAEDSGGGGSVIHEQKGRKRKDANQDEKTTRSLPASSPVPKTSLPSHKELKHFQVSSINNSQEVKVSLSILCIHIGYISSRKKILYLIWPQKYTLRRKF